MSQIQIIFLLFLLALLIYFVTYIKKRPAALLFLVGRSAAGLSFIYAFNLFCSAREIVTNISINPLTTCISAILGLPGILLAYAIRLQGFL